MRSEDRLQTLLNEAHIDTSQATDQRILGEAANAIVPPKRKQRPGMIVAAIALITIGLAILISRPQETKTAGQEQAIQPDQILTMESLKAAYHQGGMEAMEEQLDSGLDHFRPPPAAVMEDSLQRFQRNAL